MWVLSIQAMHGKNGSASTFQVAVCTSKESAELLRDKITDANPNLTFTFGVADVDVDAPPPDTYDPVTCKFLL